MQTDFFLKIDGVKGESADGQHPGAIDVESFSWGESNTTNLGSATTSGAGAGKARFDSVMIITRVSSASPQLALMCASGKHALTAVLIVRRAASGKQEEYYKMTFKTVFVTQYRSSATAASDLIPRDEIILAFGEYVIEYRPQLKGRLGSPIINGWSQITNSKV